MSLIRFKTHCMIYLYNTRKKFDLFITGHYTKSFKHSFTHNGVLILNKLPSQIKNIEPITKFKKIFIQSLDQKEFIISGRIYDIGISSSEL